MHEASIWTAWCSGPVHKADNSEVGCEQVGGKGCDLTVQAMSLTCGGSVPSGGLGPAAASVSPVGHQGPASAQVESRSQPVLSQENDDMIPVQACPNHQESMALRGQEGPAPELNCGGAGEQS